MRTFIALDLPPDFADDAAALARRLSASMEGRFLKRDTYHLTLAFLGDVDEAQLAAATDALEAACAGASPVPLRSDGLGKFGRATDATLWLGIAAARIPHVGLPHLAFPQDDEAYDVTLYKSTLDRAGAAYKPLHTVRLGTIAAERS